MLSDVMGDLVGPALGAVFLASAWPKLRRPKGFEITVANYDILPPLLNRAFARVVPPTELALGTLLVTGTLTRLTALAAAGLLFTFIIGIGASVARGRQIECGCFGTGRRTVGTLVLMEDIVFWLAALGLAGLAPGWTASESWPALGLGPVGSVRTAYAAVACLGVSITAWVVLGTVASKERRWRAASKRG